MGESQKSVGIRIIVTVGAVILAAIIVLMMITYHPLQRQSENINFTGDANPLQEGQKLRIMVWNLNGLAGGRVFDPIETPMSVTDGVLDERLKGIAGEILAVDPDILLLQEIPNGDCRTGRGDVLEKLVGMLGTNYSCYVESYYLKTAFLPQKGIMDSAGIEVGIVSRYQLTGAIRYQLPVPDWGLVRSLFNYKRCVLQARLSVSNGDDLIVMTTHLDSTHITRNNLVSQLNGISAIMKEMDTAGVPWVLGGDFQTAAPGDTHWDAAKDAQFVETIFQEMAYLPRTDVVVTNADGTVGTRTVAVRTGLIFLSTNVIDSSNRFELAAENGGSDARPLVAEVVVP